MKDKFFTLVFRGDITKLPFNPLRMNTPFGVPIACGKGDAFKIIDDLEWDIERAIENHAVDISG